MNGTVGRRVFVGSLAGAGVGAIGTTSLLDFPVSAQRAATPPLVREIRRQLKQAFGKIQNGESRGATQAATVLRLYASTVNDGQLQAALKKANRQQLLLKEMNHEELLRLAEEIGINPARLPPHSLDRVGRELALDRMIKEGLSPSMLAVADYVDGLAEKMERVERRAGGTRALQIALRQPIPSGGECGDCAREKQQLDITENIMVIACAVAVVFPILAEACAVATMTYLTFYGAYAVCLAILAFCEAYHL